MNATDGAPRSSYFNKDAVKAALDLRGVPASAKALLLALASHAGRDNGTAWPSHALLGDEAGMSVRSVVRRLVQLEAAGAIERVPRKGRSSLYRLKFYPQPLPTGAEVPTPKLVRTYDRPGYNLCQRGQTNSSKEEFQEEANGASGVALGGAASAREATKEGLLPPDPWEMPRYRYSELCIDEEGHDWYALPVHRRLEDTIYAYTDYRQRCKRCPSERIPADLCKCPTWQLHDWDLPTWDEYDDEPETQDYGAFCRKCEDWEVIGRRNQAPNLDLLRAMYGMEDGWCPPIASRCQPPGSCVLDGDAEVQICAVCHDLCDESDLAA